MVKTGTDLQQLLLQGSFTTTDLEQLGTMNAVRELKFQPKAKFPRGAFRHLQHMRWLQFLDFTETDISPTDMKDLAGIPKLKHLYLTGCPVTNAAVKHLEGHPTLVNVWLNGSRITDAALKSLATISNLEWLELDDTLITDKGLTHLCRATKLKSLGLRDTAVTDLGILQLAALPKLNMATAYVRGTAVTEAGIDAMFAARKRPKVATTAGKKLKRSASGKTARTKSTAKKPSGDAEEIAAAKKTLAGFFKAMSQWERETLKREKETKKPNGDIDLRKFNAFNKRRNEAASAIFDEYCTPKKRVYGGPKDRRYGKPLGYDPKSESIVDEEMPTRSRIVIETRRVSGFSGRYRYVLLKKRGRWLLDSKKKFGSGWENDLL